MAQGIAVSNSFVHPMASALSLSKAHSCVLWAASALSPGTAQLLTCHQTKCFAVWADRIHDEDVTHIHTPHFGDD